MIDFVEAVKEILITEHQRSAEDAKMLVEKFPTTMVNAMMAGRGKEYRAAAIALEMMEDKESRMH